MWFLLVQIFPWNYDNWDVYLICNEHNRKGFSSLKRFYFIFIENLSFLQTNSLNSTCSLFIFWKVVTKIFLTSFFIVKVKHVSILFFCFTFFNRFLYRFYCLMNFSVNKIKTKKKKKIKTSGDHQKTFMLSAYYQHLLHICTYIKLSARKSTTSNKKVYWLAKNRKSYSLRFSLLESNPKSD